MTKTLGNAFEIIFWGAFRQENKKLLGSSRVCNHLDDRWAVLTKDLGVLADGSSEGLFIDISQLMDWQLQIISDLFKVLKEATLCFATLGAN